ncbi:MAG: haloacid dehalogenase-like hydrolase, partial [Lachnospiraceae bacterium]|nr:haloacid dehalogenase-like hydrolase [Lachnospiraceae bacterium]
MIGINLELVEEGLVTIQDNTPWAMSEGRKATLANAKAAYDMGVNMILLTGNPGNGISNKAISDSLKTIGSQMRDNLILA